MGDDATFDEKFAELRRIVGHGTVKGAVVVDQVYARYQDGWGDLGNDTGVVTPTEESHGPTAEEFGHKGPWSGTPGWLFKHRQGGEAGYLTHTIDEDQLGGPIVKSWCDAISDRQPLDAVFIRNVEDISAQVALRAPIEFYGLLRGSAHPSVEREGHPVYDRPPAIPRVPEEVLQQMKVDAGVGWVHTHMGPNGGDV